MIETHTVITLSPAYNTQEEIKYGLEELSSMKGVYLIIEREDAVLGLWLCLPEKIMLTDKYLKLIKPEDVEEIQMEHGYMRLIDPAGFRIPTHTGSVKLYDNSKALSRIKFDIFKKGYDNYPTSYGWLTINGEWIVEREIERMLEIKEEDIEAFRAGYCHAYLKVEISTKKAKEA